MTIARVAAGGTAGNASGGNLACTIAAATAGNILVASLYREAQTWTLPGGWTQIGSDQRDFNNNLYLTVAWYLATGGETSFTFNLSGTTWRTIAIDEFSGVDTVNPINVGPTGRGTNESMIGSGPIASSITTTVANTMLVAAHGNYNGTDVTAGSSGFSSGNGLGGVELWYLAQAAAGASGDKQFGGFSSSDQGLWATLHFALQEPTAVAAKRLMLMGVG